jgi:hypothetical protein
MKLTPKQLAMIQKRTPSPVLIFADFTREVMERIAAMPDGQREYSEATLTPEDLQNEYTFRYGAR